MSDPGPPVFGHRRHEEPAAVPLPEAPITIRRPKVPAGATPSHSVGGAGYSAATSETATRVTDAARQQDIASLRAICMAAMDATAVAQLPPARLLIEVERLISDEATEHRVQLNGSEQRQLAVEVVDDMIGLGPLDPLLADESITDITVNGPDHIFVERAGKLVHVPAHFRDNEHLTNICQRIAASVGRHVDEASPMVDARLKDGSRVNIVLPPLSIDGPALSIRKFSKKPIDFEKLIAYGSLTPPLAHALEICARCRLNIIISGGTGSGKTTLLDALSRFIDPAERIITVEDTAELQLQQPQVVRMETRPPSLEGKGEVDVRALVRNALRMRPDRIIVGEVRGAEAFDMLQAMNTGHDGSMSTIHANSARDALSRIENMVQMSAMGLSSKSIRTQLAAAVNIIIQLDRQRDGVRRVVQLTEITGMEGDMILLKDIFKFRIEIEANTGNISGWYEIDRAQTTFAEKLQYFGLEHDWTEALKEAATEAGNHAEV